MQQRATAEKNRAGRGSDRRRVETVLQTLTSCPGCGESLAELAHETRNMVTALELYCDLIEEPGVLASRFSHYGAELRLVAAASRRLVEKMVELDGIDAMAASPHNGHAQARMLPGSISPAGLTLQTGKVPRGQPGTTERWPAWPQGAGAMAIAGPAAGGGVKNLAAELLAARNLLSAIAGPSTAVLVDAEGGARATRIASEDLTRVLVNLVKNAAEAMPGGGRILIGLREIERPAGIRLRLTVEDNGPGIPEEALERVFESGYTCHRREDGRPLTHRGLGLAITRAIIEAAGGWIHAENRPEGGARMIVNLPAKE